MQTFAYIYFNDDILDFMTTDYIVLGALLLFFINGWRKGVLKTLLAPISMIIGCLGALLYYRQTHNITT